jgi:hypothetical protein
MPKALGKKLNLIEINKMLPTIEFDKSLCDFVPSEKVNPDEKWIKHIHCEGARFHVLSYYVVCDFPHLYNGTIKIRCSEPNCIYNKE